MIDIVGYSFPVMLNFQALNWKRKSGLSELVLFEKSPTVSTESEEQQP